MTNKYEGIISELRNNFREDLWNDLLLEIPSSRSSVLAHETNPKAQYTLTRLIKAQTLNPHPNWYRQLLLLIKTFYQKCPDLAAILYKCLPVLLQRYIQGNQLKEEGLEECLIAIYNQEYEKLNRSHLKKADLCKEAEIKSTYLSQLGKPMGEPRAVPMEPIGEINNQGRIRMKALMFYLVYANAGDYREAELYDYYRALLIYCGAEEKPLAGENLYQLERSCKLSTFRYAVSEEELEWIILTLYELSMRFRKHKLDLLAVINAIHRKVSNESLFRVSDIAASLIQLLQDEYSQTFL